MKSLTNELIAKTGVFYEKTVAVLMDERPGFDSAAAKKVIDFLRENGYYVYEVTAEELCEKTKVTIGFFLLIPHAESVPAVCATTIREFWEQGGQIITLGGTLFSKWVEKEDDKWVVKELNNTEFDAAYSGKTTPIVIEGITPSYKAYHYNKAEKFVLEDEQIFNKYTITTNQPLQVVCPVARSRGDGYACEHKYRYIPLVNIVGEGGRSNGLRGAAAFIMLSDTKGHLPFTNGNRPGSVSSTTFGSAIGSIGITKQDIMSVEGADKVLLSMLNAMEKGLYIFEAGADQPIYEDGDIPVIGAKILNLSQDFEEVEIKFIVTQSGNAVLDETETVLATPRSYSEVNFRWEDYKIGDYEITVELYKNGQKLDFVNQTVTKFVRKKITDKDKFVKVEGDSFILENKKWYSWGMNYWPLYYPSFERNEYWMCWFDKSNYFPNEVESDLQLMEEMGINTLYIRLDADVFGRCIPQIRDFIVRCEKHNMKISLSYPNATCPINYSGKAFEKMMNELDLTDNPILFGHDIAWEIGHQLLFDEYRYYWDAPWAEWINERYGSVENAEKDFGCEIDKAADGRITAPPIEQFSSDGDWRIKIAAYRRFIDDYMSSLWNKAVADIKRIDPNHIVAFRKGPNQPQAVSFNIGVKHADYTSPEGYEVTHDEKGYHVSCANTMIMNLVSGNKPVIWSEYGLTLTGLRWTELIWDHVNQEPFAYRIEKTTSYIEQYYRMFKRLRVNGSAPWWWCGGFRMVEMSDCGFCGPDGTLRPFGQSYIENGDWFKAQGDAPKADREVLVDPDLNAGGYNYVCDELLWKENKTAEEKGEYIKAITAATGTNTVNAPLIAIGNVEYNGTNPPKYFNAEFNTVKIIDSNGNIHIVEKGGAVELPNGDFTMDVSVGNLQEPTWIAGDNDSFGTVCLKTDEGSDISFKLPILSDTKYLNDAQIKDSVKCELSKTENSVIMQMTVNGRADFGEKFNFTILKKQ